MKPNKLVLGLAALLSATTAFAQDVSPQIIQIDARPGQEAVRVTVQNLGPATAPAGVTVQLREQSATGTLLGSAVTTAAIPVNGQSVVVVNLPRPYNFNLSNGVAKMIHAVVSGPGDTNASNNTNWAYRFTADLNPPVRRQHRVLVVTVQGPSYAQHGPQLQQTVQNAGGQVDHLYLTPTTQAGVINALANPANYDQVWVYDLSSNSDNAPNAFAAIANWFNQNPSRDIIADGRIIATLWNNLYLTSGMTISANYYHNLRVRGGGLMLGTDHGAVFSGVGPRNGSGVFVDGINSINDRIGIGRFWGDPGGSVAGMQLSDNNPVRNIPNNLGSGVNSQSSPSNAPTGFQQTSNVAPGVVPLQRTFYTVAWHNGSSSGGAATPAISTTIVGSLGFNVAIQAPCRAPAQGASNLLTLNVSSGAVSPLTYQWTSSISGNLGTGTTVNTASLPAGRHVINVVVSDATNFRPGDSIVVDVGGGDCNSNCVPDSEELASGDTAPQNGVLDVCEDEDGDGVSDPLDGAPCDPVVQTIQFAPSRGNRATLMFEDWWPGQTDVDFNDLVVGWNATLQRNSAGDVSRIRMSFDVLAVGASLRNGLGLELPVAPSNVASISRSIEGGPQSSLALRSGPQTTFHVIDDVRALFPAGGFVNTVPGEPRHASVRVVVDVAFRTPVALSGLAPWDLFLFRSGVPSHQIHLPNFSGTAEMDGSLFGQENDGSGNGRWFVNTQGLPYALSLPQLVLYPTEQTDIALLFPDIVGFATSSGTANQNFWATNVQTAHAYSVSYPVASSLPPVSEAVIDVSCLP